MFLSELHIALANSLGDPVVYVPTGPTKDQQFTGNVRYSAANRESYLQRAMQKIMSDALAAVADRSRAMQVRVLQTWFPTSTALLVNGNTLPATPDYLVQIPNLQYLYSVAVKFPGFSGPKEGYIYGAAAAQFGHFMAGVSVPVLSSADAIKRAASRGHTDKAPYAYVIGYMPPNMTPNNTLVHVIASRYLDTVLAMTQGVHWAQSEPWMQYEITYLPKVPDLNLFIASQAIPFEEMYWNDVLRYASLYGMLDSQEIDPVNGAAAQLQQKHFVLTPDMGQQNGYN